MYTNVNFDTFARAFLSIRPDNFTYDGLRALFDYLEGIEEDTGTQIELDVIAICCDFSEDTAKDIVANYDCGIDNGDYAGSAERYLEEQGVLIAKIDNDDGTFNFLYQQH